MGGLLTLILQDPRFTYYAEISRAKQKPISAAISRKEQTLRTLYIRDLSLV